MRISNLRDRPEFADQVADRGWHAWWTQSGVPLSAYRAGLEQMISGEGIPTAFVAHDGETYLGSALLIDNDLDERPLYGPWIAALWVEPDARRQGLAQALTDAARAEAKRLGIAILYLCATPENSPYYEARGFTRIESDVAGLNIFTIASA